MKKATYVFLFVFLVILASSSFAEESEDICRANKEFYKDKERGWYYREYCEPLKPSEEVKEHEEVEALVEETEEEAIDWEKIQDTDYLDSITAEEFRELFDFVKDEVVYNPTHEKLLAYLKLQDYMRKKSLTFAYVWRDVLLKNPEFDTTLKNPGSNFGALAKAKITDKEEKKTVEEIKEHVGLFFFVSGECPYCHEEAKVIDILRREHNIAVRTISSDFCDNDFKDCSVRPNLFSHFSVQVTPTIVAVFKNDESGPNFFPIGTGMITVDQIVKRLIFYYNYHKTGQYPSS